MHTFLSFRSVVVFSALVLMSCGGSVVDVRDDAGTGGGSTGGANTGGANTGGGGAGGGLSDGGAGGGVGGGTGGSIAGGMGGGTGGSPACEPMPSCNWCGGSPKIDGAGCVVGYVCANGVDPCKTQPCGSSVDCAGGMCQDQLCWGGPVTCTNMECGGQGGSGPSSCSCKWSCSDNNAYSFDCTQQTGGVSCSCMINGQTSGQCANGGGGAGGGPVNVCDSCCGFPQ